MNPTNNPYQPPNAVAFEKCDGNHAMPECGDPGCWQKPTPTPHGFSRPASGEACILCGMVESATCHVRPDRCPTCGSADKNKASRMEGGTKEWCYDSFHDTSDAATPAPEPWRPKFKKGDTVKAWLYDGTHKILSVHHDRQCYTVSGFNGDFTEPKLELVASAPWSLPAPPAGHEWHRNDFTEPMLPPGTRPLCLGEKCEDGDEVLVHGAWTDGIDRGFPMGRLHLHTRTTRPAPSPAQPEPQPPTTAQTAGEAVWMALAKGLSWQESAWGTVYQKPFHAAAQAAIAFAQSSLTQASGGELPSDRDGKWIDKYGCCKVCDGEIPHGHMSSCDIFKLEEQVRALERERSSRMDDAGKVEMPSVDDLLKLYWDNGGDRVGISAVREACMRAKAPTVSSGWDAIVEVEIAPELREFARQGIAIDTEMQRRGHDEWELGQIAARRLVTRLKERAEAAEQTISDLRRELSESNQQREKQFSTIRGLQKELASLKASSGWVAVSERKPTKEDADERGDVQWAHPLHSWSAGWRAGWRFPNSATHWRRTDHPIPTPPPSPEEEERKVITVHDPITDELLETACVVLGRWLSEHPELSELVLKRTMAKGLSDVAGVIPLGSAV